MIPMNPKVNIAVIIPAAGFSKRFGGSTPKQFLRLGDETVIEKSVNLFLEINKIKKITSDKLFKTFFGETWTENFINNFLFTLNHNPL